MDKPDEPKLTLAAVDGQPVKRPRGRPKGSRNTARGSDGDMPRSKWKPTARQQRMISVAIAAGLNHEEVAGVIGISVRTLQRRYRKELDDGAAMINAKVASKLFSKCMKGDTIALIFWAKSRLGWNDRQRIEVTGKGGGPIQHETVQAEADAFTSRIASMADRFAKVMASDADEEEPANDGELAQKSTEAVGE